MILTTDLNINTDPDSQHMDDVVFHKFILTRLLSYLLTKVFVRPVVCVIQHFQYSVFIQGNQKVSNPSWDLEGFHKRIPVGV